MAQGDDLARDPQPQTEAAVRSRFHASLETFEDALLLLLRYSNSVIANGDHDSVFFFLRRDFDGTAGAVLDRIAEQVGEHLIDAGSIPISVNTLFHANAD